MPTTSINSLPVETLSEIFTHSSNSSSADGGYKIILSAKRDTSESFARYPWNLRLTCKHWDEVVVSSPQLWSNFLLDACSLPEEKYGIDTTAMRQRVFSAPIASSLRFCLSRSKNRLLHFSIKASYDYLAYLPTLLSMLLPYANQWETLDLDFPVDGFDSRHRDFMTYVDLLCSGTSFPQLRELKIKSDTASGWQVHPYSLASRLFRNAPLLSKLQYSDNPYWLCLNFPVSHITDFTTIIDPHGACARCKNTPDALPLMPALVSLTVLFQRCRNAYAGFGLPLPVIPPSSSKSIPLQRLNLLGVSSIEEKGPFPSFFKDLPRCPALTHLKISPSQIPRSLLSALESFFQKSECTIRSLYLGSIDPEPLLKFIRTLPRLETLDIGLVNFNKALNKGLTFPSELDTAQCNGRWIKKLVIRNPMIHWESQVDGFVGMLESRLGLADRGEQLRCGLEYLYVVFPAGTATRKRNRLVKLLTALRSSYGSEADIFLSDHRLFV